ncbi:uncharacterized protein N7479_005418 [Penicillium vulpinum]|uniref:Uncharacterized protein n=1 Tax=Penicillium vulpinum TaxID=29845 RepID=A0A1V6SDN4_9EURO|nr:uncharacterized protein N7479_005418 [Penicillium vulpinum]KAJ5958268.1 hypothetical protein N7479_005418 [Penicillium vulpinum]OQE12117.1 hypothetical protein PENVUL_c001G02813 [Penicillium vulpinum]
MFRNPRDVAPDAVSSAFSQILEPLPVISWGQLAMYYLGAPTGAGYHMFVVRDEHHQTAIQKLTDSGFTQAPPDRRPAPEILESLPDPQAVLDEINKGYERLDRYCTSFQFPPHLPFSGDQIFLIPNSFAQLPLEYVDMTSNQSNQKAQLKQYEVYGNLFYPLEAALIESFVKGVIHDIEEVGFSSWELLLNAWISMMRGYLEVNNDILDDCADERAVEWYSTHFGRIREEQYGEWDLRVSNLLGSGKDMPVDMRENPIP